MTLEEVIGGIFTNLFSSFLEEKIGAYKDKKKLCDFCDDLKIWTHDFYNMHDGSILTSNSFNNYILNNKVIEQIIKYVTRIEEQDKMEIDFIKSIEENLEEYFKYEDEAFGGLDRSISSEFFETLLDKVKNFIFEKINPNDRGLMYLVFQVNCELSKLSDTVQEQYKIVFSDLSLIKEFVEDERQKKETLSELSIKYYKAWIKLYLDKKMLLYADKKVDINYNDIICNISGILENSWKSELIKVVEATMKNIDSDSDDYNKFIEGIELIHNFIEYDIALNIIEEIITESKLPKKTYKDIKVHMDSRFNKVVVISGEPHSGKTHFLKEYIRYILLNKATNFIVPVEYHELIDIDLKGMEALCLNKINECFNLSLEKLTDVSICEDLVKERFQITLMVDNIQKLYINNSHSFHKVLEFIQKMSKYDYLNWIISVSEFDAYIFDDTKNTSFLSKYCVDFKHLYLEMESETMFDYTVNITLLNDKFTIGNKILESYGIRQYSPENIENRIIGIYNPLNIPLYAHIMGNNYTGEEIIPYVVTYYDFIREIVELIITELDIYEKANCNNIENSIIKIVDLVFKNKRVLFSENELFGICNREIIDLLRENYLLKINRQNEKDIFSLRHLEDNYELYTRIYWVVKMISVQIENEKKDYIRIYNNLNSIQEYKDELIPCYLLYLDSKKDDSYNNLLSTLFIDHNINYALFCSLKASLDFTQGLSKIIMNTTINSLNKVETFGMLYYLYYYNSKNNEKFMIINKCAKSILDNGLLYNFNLVLDKILDKVVNIKNFKHDILELFTLDVKEVNSIVGYKCGLKYHELCENQSMRIQINNIWMYLIQHKESIGNSTGVSFLDWFLRTYFEQNIYKYGIINLYELLEERQYFFSEKKLGLLFRRNFACAAGNTYAKDISTQCNEDYINVIKKIMKNNDKKNNIFVFHLISNSIDNDWDEHKLVKPELRGFLLEIWNNPELSKFCMEVESRRLFFERNIKNI